jgi:hypothetical protein
MTQEAMQMLNKKGVRLLDQWAEIFAFSVMAMGLIIAFLSDSALISYAIITLCGFVVGRTYYMRRSRLGFPFYLISFFFLFGYVIGTQITHRGHFAVIILCFCIGTYIGNTAYKRGLLR